MTSNSKFPSVSNSSHEPLVDTTRRNRSIEFFDAQFRRQVRENEYALNPFEAVAIEYLKGTILDLGSGLGNLSLEAGRRGHEVLAVDASQAAVSRINADARSEGLRVKAIQTDIVRWQFDRTFDTIIAVGLLMFFPRERALDLLRAIQEHVTPSGRVIVNVLVEGTTYMAMFDRKHYYLFRRDEIEALFAGWTILFQRYEAFPAPGETLKCFVTIVAEKAQPSTSRLG